MIPNERLDELAKLEAAATPGPWRLVEPPIWAEPIAEQDRRDDAFRVASRNEFCAMVEQCREANRLTENFQLAMEVIEATDCHHEWAAKKVVWLEAENARLFRILENVRDIDAVPKGPTQ